MVTDKVLSENRILPERRLTAAERRAGRRFIAQLLERFPRVARLAYPVRGEESAIVYVRMPIPAEFSLLIDEFAAALTGVIHEQEKIRVLLIPDEFTTETPIADDLELKVVQAQLSCDMDALRKLKKFKDEDAALQREFYSQRYREQMARILSYLGKAE